MTSIATEEADLVNYNADFELYVLREDLTVNPIPERAAELRSQAVQENGLCDINIPPYTDTDTVDSYLTAVVSSVSGPDCGVTLCRSEGCHACVDDDGDATCIPCTTSDDCDGLQDVVEYRYCDCDGVVTVDAYDKFLLYTVSYKTTDMSPNDITLIAIFNELLEGETVDTIDHFGFSINSPVYPPTIPRFKTMSELTAAMSQVITDFTHIDTTITAVYNPATDVSYGSFMFGVEFKKGFEYGVSFNSTLSLGDFASISVEESHLVVGGSFLLSNEFGVILGPDDVDGLKAISQVVEDNCTSADQNLDFDIVLYHNTDAPVAHNISITSCAEGISARVETVKSSIHAVMNKSDITVSLVGTSTLVLAFDPYWSKTEMLVPDVNIYGLNNGTFRKGGYHFANGATALHVDLGLSGGATVSATVLDSIEVAAGIDAFIGGSLDFNAGTSGKLIQIDDWFSNIKSMWNASDEFHEPDFATASITVDGSFEASVEVREPFALDLPVSFGGSFASPFELDLLNLTAAGIKRPDIKFDIDLPNIGDIKNLSFGEVVKLLKQALEFLVGDPEEGDTVESCSGGLLGKEIFGKNIFTYKIPVLGISACDFAGFLQIVVDAIDQMVNSCTECDDPDAPKSSFNVLGTKLSALLQDAVGGTPSVVFSPTSDTIRSSLDVDLILQWSFMEAIQLNVDLASILDGLDIDEDFKKFAKGLIAFNGQGQTEISGSISFALGIGLEYIKKTKRIVPYIRGITGITLNFAADADAQFQASIGPLSADIDLVATIGNFGEPLSISFGLNPTKNYYLSSDKSLSRAGFQRVSGIKALGKEISVAVRGQVEAEIEAVFLRGLGEAFCRLKISDINNIIQRKPGAVSLYYKVSTVEVPSILDVLLMDPVAIVDAVDNLFKLINDLTLGRRGIVTNFPVPFIGTAISRALKAGSSDNFLEKARRTVKGTLDQVLNTYEVDDGNSTAADLLANVLTDLLGNRLDILKSDVTVTYYEHDGTQSLIPHDKYNRGKKVVSN